MGPIAFVPNSGFLHQPFEHRDLAEEGTPRACRTSYPFCPRRHVGHHPGPGTDLRAWLFTILHNQHVNDVRRSAREGNNVSIDDAAPMLTTQSNAFDAVQLRDLEAAIAKLPEEQSQAILLIGLEGMRYDEVAVILGVPIGTVRSRLSRGRDQLRELIGMEPKVRAAAAAKIEAENRAA